MDTKLRPASSPFRQLPTAEKVEDNPKERIKNLRFIGEFAISLQENAPKAGAPRKICNEVEGLAGRVAASIAAIDRVILVHTATAEALEKRGDITRAAERWQMAADAVSENPKLSREKRKLDADFDKLLEIGEEVRKIAAK